MDARKKNFSEEVLLDSGVVTQKNPVQRWIKRLLYFLISPQRWKLWLYTLFLDLKYSHAYLGIKAYNGNFLLSKKIKNPLIGIEVDPSIATVARKRFGRYGNVNIITGSVETVGVLNGTVFYLANPFFEPVLENFANQLLKKIKGGCFKDANRPLIIYYYCYHLSVFENNPEWEVKKLDGVFAALIYPAQKFYSSSSTAGK